MVDNVLTTLFSSKTRIKIIEALLKLHEVNITKLTKLLGLNHRVVKYHIEVLRDLGLIEERRFGRIRIIKLNDRNPIVQVLQNFVKEIERVEKTG